MNHFSPGMLLLEICTGVLLILTVRSIFGRKFGPRICRLFWFLVIVRALVPFSIPWTCHPVGFLGFEQKTKQSYHDISPERIESDQTTVDVSKNFISDVSETKSEQMKKQDRPGLLSEMNFFHAIMLVWLVGLTAILLTAIFRNRRIVADATRFPTPVPDWVQEIFLDLRKELRLGIWPVLIVSPCVPSPCLVGAMRPRILLPESLVDDRSNSETIRFVLLHEMSHLKSGDVWLSWLWAITLGVHWFNPLFWLFDRWMKLDVESACDDRVLEFLERNSVEKERSEQNYAASLLHVMQILNPSPTAYATGSCAVIETPSNLERRIETMKSYKKNNVRRTLIGILILLFLAGLTLTGYAEKPKPISAEKAQMIGYVEDFFMNNYRDITMRKSLEWGDAETDKDGNIGIRYKYDALIWDKDRITENKVWTFKKDGEFVSVQNVEGFPKQVKAEKPDTSAKEGLQKLVEKFFSENFRDITARKTIEWGEREISYDQNRNELVCIRYKYEATIRGGETIIQNKIWTFEKDGKFVSIKDYGPELKSKTAEPKPDPKASQRATAAGWRLFMQGKPEEAEPKFQEAVRLDPENPNAYQGLGWAQTNQQLNDEAKETFKKCLELDPKNAAALNGLGVIARWEGDEKTMLDVWHRAVEFDKKATAPIAGLADYYEKKDKEIARKYYELWIKADPYNQDAQEGLKRNQAEAAK